MAAERAEPLGIRYVHADVASAGWVGPPDDRADLPDVPTVRDERPLDAVTCNLVCPTSTTWTEPWPPWRGRCVAAACSSFSILHPCFAGSAAASGAWPSSGTYYDEGFWLADGRLSTLRHAVGANHRTLSTYIIVVRRHALWLDEVREPRPRATWTDSERRDAARLPVYLVVRCEAAVGTTRSRGAGPAGDGRQGYDGDGASP